MENEYTEFDENNAVNYINNYLLAKGKSQYDDDDLLLLIDAMYDYFEENDSFDEDTDDFTENIDDIVKYVLKAISKDRENKIQKDDVKDIVTAEIEYESTLE